MELKTGDRTKKLYKISKNLVAKITKIWIAFPIPKYYSTICLASFCIYLTKKNFIAQFCQNDANFKIKKQKYLNMKRPFQLSFLHQNTSLKAMNRSTHWKSGQMCDNVRTFVNTAQNLIRTVGKQNIFLIWIASCNCLTTAMW